MYADVHVDERMRETTTKEEEEEEERRRPSVE
jgi:hypothetical protein